MNRERLGQILDAITVGVGVVCVSAGVGYLHSRPAGVVTFGALLLAVQFIARSPR